MKVALAFLTKDRVELSERTIRSLLGIAADLFLIDGSVTEEGQIFPGKIATEHSVSGCNTQRIYQHLNIRGGPDAAVAYALTVMLAGTDYTHVGIVESDVLLADGWCGPCLALFERGIADGLEVGTVSARCYEDRILFQRNGYAVCHNLGWGMQILTRQAAELTLANMRTGMTSELRRTFVQLAGKDIGTYYAFRTMEHNTCADWQNDKMLAAHGLASLALVPSPVEMIGQEPPLHEQGLKIADKPVEWLRDDKAFEAYAAKQQAIRSNAWNTTKSDWFLHDSSGYTYFAHHLPKIGGKYEGDWRLKWTMGFGPFGWKASHYKDVDKYGYGKPVLTVPLFGPASFLVSGGEQGGKVHLVDIHSGYEITPELQPEGGEGKVMQLVVPGAYSYRTCRLTMLTPGTCFYGVKTVEEQPSLPGVAFSWKTLPRV